jgi:hypothetical protein
MDATERNVVLPTSERKESSNERAEKTRLAAGELPRGATAAPPPGLVSDAGCTITPTVPDPSTEAFL